MLLHDSVTIRRDPLHIPSELSKLRKSITIVFFFIFKSCGGKSAVSIELRNSGINSIPPFFLSFTESKLI